MTSGNEKISSVFNSLRGGFVSLFLFIKSYWRFVFRYAVIAAAVTVSFLIGGSYVVWLTKKDEIVSNLDKFKNEVTNYYEISQIRPIRILDRNGKLIGEFSRRKFKPIRTDNLAEHGNVVWALLSSEDREFYNHHGVNYAALLRAIIINLTTFQKQGGSTITQQLAKLTLDLGARNIFNKITEFYCTFYLESQFDKIRFFPCISIGFSWERETREWKKRAVTTSIRPPRNSLRRKRLCSSGSFRLLPIIIRSEV